MELEVLGWPPDGPKLRLDYERFSYAGKFVMTNTGKAVAQADDDRTGDRTTENSGGTTDYTSRATDADDRSVDSDDPAPDYDDDVLAAASFNEDRTDAETLWIRYVTVASSRRGDGIGPALLAFVRDRAIGRGYARVRIAVNNPFAYEALYRAGFVFTGETTGLAELVLEYLGPNSDPDPDVNADWDERERYQTGLEKFRDRDLSGKEEAFLESQEGSGPPETGCE